MTHGGGHSLHAEKLRPTTTEAAAALAWAGRYRTVAGNLRVAEVQVAPGGDGDGGARTVRFVICHHPKQAERDRHVRATLTDHLAELIDSSIPGPRRRDELVGSLTTTPGLRRTRTGLRIDHPQPAGRSTWTGTWLLRTSDVTLTGEALAAAAQQLLAVDAPRPARTPSSSTSPQPLSPDPYPAPTCSNTTSSADIRPGHTANSAHACPPSAEVRSITCRSGRSARQASVTAAVPSSDPLSTTITSHHPS